MPLSHFRAHATWPTCLSSYAFTFLTDEPRLRSAGGCIRRCRRLRRGYKPMWKDSVLFWQRRDGEAIRALRAVCQSFLATAPVAPILDDASKRKVLRDPGARSVT